MARTYIHDLKIKFMLHNLVWSVWWSRFVDLSSEKKWPLSNSILTEILLPCQRKPWFIHYVSYFPTVLSRAEKRTTCKKLFQLKNFSGKKNGKRILFAQILNISKHLDTRNYLPYYLIQSSFSCWYVFFALILDQCIPLL